MNEKKGVVTLEGNPMTLLGTELKVGKMAPDVELTNNDMKPVKISSFRGKVCILSAVPSLDTPVCDKETRRFNEEASKLGSSVAVITVSMDLPFAQKRWCGSAGIKNVTTLSDYREGTFGVSYGAMIKELKLLSRVVYILDKEGVIRYIQQVGEVTKEPNYAKILDEVKKLI